MAAHDLDIPIEARDTPPLVGRWLGSSSLVGGALILGIVVLAAAAAPLITPYDPIEIDLGNALLPPSSEHLLGTDHLGRDVWARLLYGARVDLLIGFGAVLAPFIIGTVLGSLAGYFGGRIDTIISSAVDLVFAFPYYVLIIALVFSLGPGIPSVFVAMAIVAWVSYARIIRAEVISEKEKEYVLAARTQGFGDAHILLWHIFPNVITQGIVYAMSDIVVIIKGVATLSYFGLGVPPPTPEWGSMIAAGQNHLRTNWYLATVPGLTIVVVGVGFALLGDGIADLLKPE